MGALINLKGRRFGRLKVINRIKNDNHNQVVWKCKCDCDNIVNIICRSLVHNRTKSCGCLHIDKVRKKPYYYLFRSIQYICKKSKKKCFLTFNDFLKFTKIKNCHYCKDEVKWNPHNKDGIAHYNLDRKNNSVGYTKENCVVCCPRCNQMKRNLGYSEFYKFTFPIRLYKNMKNKDKDKMIVTIDKNGKSMKTINGKTSKTNSAEIKECFIRGNGTKIRTSDLALRKFTKRIYEENKL